MIIDSHQHVMLPTESQLALMDTAGVDRTILFSSLPHPERATDLDSLDREMGVLAAILSGQPYPLERRRLVVAEQVQAIARHPDRVVGFGAVPLGLSPDDTAAWVRDDVLAHGFRGLGELNPPSGRVALLDVVFAVSAAHGDLPLWVHTLDPLTLVDIRELAALARRYPSVPVIFGHLGGWQWGDTIRLAQDLPRAYLDLSGTYTTLAPAMAIRTLPARTLFSSDAPYGNPLVARTMVEQVTADPAVRARVLGGTIAELLRLP